MSYKFDHDVKLAIEIWVLRAQVVAVATKAMFFVMAGLALMVWAIKS